MDLAKLILELGLIVWLVVVLRRHRAAIEHPRVLAVMTGGAFVGNVALTYLGIIRSPAIAATLGEVSAGVLHAMLWFGILKWTALVYLITRVALLLLPQIEGGGFALLRTPRRLDRALVAGLGLGLGGTVIVIVASRLYVAAGVFEHGIWDAAIEAGVGWEIGVLGGLRNLFGEEVITRLGVQTLLLFHLRDRPRGPVVALLGSALFFEIWHSSLRDFYFINFSASCLWAWGYRRWGYEAAAVGHFVADLLGVALPIYLLSGPI